METRIIRMSVPEATDYIMELAAQFTDHSADRALDIAITLYVAQFRAEAEPIISNPSMYPDLHDEVLMDWDRLDYRGPSDVPLVHHNRALTGDLDLYERWGMDGLLHPDKYGLK